jgi:hypothetical protein
MTPAAPGEPDHGGAAAARTLVFRVGPERFGLPLSAVREVFAAVETPVPIPAAPRWAAGLLNHHGQAVLAVRLGELLAVAPGTTGSQYVLVQLPQESIALAVDEIEALEVLSLEGPGGQEQRRAWLRGTLVNLLEADTLCHLLGAWQRPAGAPIPPGAAG